MLPIVKVKLPLALKPVGLNVAVAFVGNPAETEKVVLALYPFCVAKVKLNTAFVGEHTDTGLLVAAIV